MGIFDRLSTMIRSNINDLISRAENPEKMLNQLISDMKREGAKVIVVEPYFSLKTPESIASRVGGTVLVLAPSVNGIEGVTDYIQLFDYNVSKLAAALRQAAGK